jgi:microcystin-dependent protein
MSDSYVGEIRLVGFTFAPVGWALCQGQLLSISQNEILYNLIGTTYGGDGFSTFGLPDLRGRCPVHAGIGQGISYPIGQLGGAYQVTLTVRHRCSARRIPVATTKRHRSHRQSESGA